MTEEGALRTYYTRSGSSVLAEYSEVNLSGVLQWDKNYVYMGGRLLATQQRSGTAESIQYHHPDRLGTRLVTNAADTTVQEQTTLPYGVSLETSAATDRRFTSYERNAATGLDYAVNRHYDSMQGRFTQVDPIGMKAASLSNPQSLNLYAYCGNDPVNLVDPTGLLDGLPNVGNVDIPISFDEPIIDSFFFGLNGLFGGWARRPWITENERPPIGPGREPENPQIPIDIGDPPPNGMGCDLKLAKLFGGRGAVASTQFEPRNLVKSPGETLGRAGMDRGPLGHSATPRNDAPSYLPNGKPNPDRGGIFHLYANDRGTPANVGLYVPQGFSQVGIIAGVNNRMAFTNSDGVTIVFVHVAPRSGANDNTMGSSRIGNIGGPGGESPRYFHTHIYTLTGYDPADPDSPQEATRVDPRSVFCKEFGF
jgi:RHS repeat-associated protein